MNVATETPAPDATTIAADPSSMGSCCRQSVQSVFYFLRSDDGEEEAGSASVVEGRCEDLKGFGESKGFGTSGGEEAASDARRRCAEGDVTGRKVPINHSETEIALGAEIATGCRNGSTAAQFSKMGERLGISERLVWSIAG
jgi:hypothetical protein